MDATEQQSTAGAGATGEQTPTGGAAGDAQAAQLALYQAQQLQLLQQMMQQQPNAEQLRQLYGNSMMMMPQFMLNSPLFRGSGSQPASTETQEEEPVYVNAKQYHRIMIRRQQRAKLEAKLGNARQRKAYLHDSRHKHAMRRPRGPGGRFLTKSEIAALKDGSLRLEDLPLKAAKHETA